MQRSQLEHLIRAAAEIANEYGFVIVGSQSILGVVASPQPEYRVSMEADIYALQAPGLADLIDGANGELSFFHHHCGDCAQGVLPRHCALATRLVSAFAQAAICSHQRPGWVLPGPR